jgi:hypothetical protein
LLTATKDIYMRRGREDGFTFNEVLVTMALVFFAVMSSSVSSLNFIRRQSFSDNSTVAIHLAHDKMEELQARRPLLDVNLCPGGGDHGLSSKNGVAGIFDRCWRIAPSSLGSNLKQIDVVVSWRDHDTHETAFTTLVFMGE